MRLIKQEFTIDLKAALAEPALSGCSAGAYGLYWRLIFEMAKDGGMLAFDEPEKLMDKLYALIPFSADDIDRGLEELTDRGAIKIVHLKDRVKIQQGSGKPETPMQEPLFGFESAEAGNLSAEAEKPASGAVTGTRFIPPTLEEVAAYCAARGNGIDAAKFIAHYAAVDWYWKKGLKMKNWRQAIITWERNNKNYIRHGVQNSRAGGADNNGNQPIPAREYGEKF